MANKGDRKDADDCLDEARELFAVVLCAFEKNADLQFTYSELAGLQSILRMIWEKMEEAADAEDVS